MEGGAGYGGVVVAEAVFEEIEEGFGVERRGAGIRAGKSFPVGARSGFDGGFNDDGAE